MFVSQGTCKILEFLLNSVFRITPESVVILKKCPESYYTGCVIRECLCWPQMPRTNQWQCASRASRGKAFLGEVSYTWRQFVLQNKRPSLSRNCWLMRFFLQQWQLKQWGHACQWNSPCDRPGESAVITRLHVLHTWNENTVEECIFNGYININKNLTW